MNYEPHPDAVLRSTRQVDYRIEPVFNIADSAAYQAWHVPLGDLRRLDEVLADMDDLRYVPLGAAHYM